MRNTTACVLDGCERRSGKDGGYCPGHQQRIKRLGYPGSPEFRRSPGSAAPTCSVADCEEPSNSRGFCKGHYQRWYDGRDLTARVRKSPKPKTSQPCKIDGCEGYAKARGWCNPHYQRWWASGDPGPTDLPRRGLTAVCSADGCEREHRTGGFCDTHYRRARRGVPQDSLTFLTPPVPQRHDGYAAVHMRIAAKRGKASSHSCACGQSASQWAYQHNDPQELLSPGGHPYSLDIFGSYKAMCRPCHVAFDHDLDERAARKANAN